MKKLLILLLCVSIGYACKKNNQEPQQLVQSTSTHCDTITCELATKNGWYEWYQEPTGDTLMTGHKFRLVYTHKDSIWDANIPFWRVFYHYKVAQSTFNLNIIKPICLVDSHYKHAGSTKHPMTTKAGHFAYFKLIQLVH